MKNILKLMALFAFLLCFISCDEDEKAEIPTLSVTAANLNGTWQLSEWNGQPMAEGKYVRCEKVPASIIEEAKVDKD